MRSRTYLENEEVGQHRNYKNGAWQGKTANTTMSSYSSTMEDVVTPNFHRRKENGEIIINPCSMHVYQRSTTGSGSVTQVQNASPHTVWTASGSGTITGYYQKYGGGSPSYVGVGMPDLDDTVAIAKAKCLANVDSTPYSFAEDLYEIRQTLDFLKSPLFTLKRISWQYSKLRDAMFLKHRGATIRRSKKLVGDLANLWLEYRFAVSPIFRSVLAIMEAHEAGYAYRPERRTSRAMEKYPKRTSKAIVPHSATGRTFTYECSTASEGSVRAGILYEVENPVSDFQYNYGLRFKDIPETFWAVMPLSFMLDRFYNISDFIGGFVNLSDPNVKVLGAWVVEKKELTSSVGVRSVFESGYTSTIAPDDIVSRNFYYTRSIWEPTLADAVPTLNLRGLVRTAATTTDLLALLYKNFKT